MRAGDLRLSQIQAEMEGGLQVEVGAHRALRMRSGTIHEVDTRVGGFIVTKGYIDESTAVLMSRWLVGSETHLQRMHDSEKDLALANWIDAMSLASSSDVRDSWQLASDVLLSISRGSSARTKRLCQFFRDMQHDQGRRWTEDALQRLVGRAL